MHSSLFTPDWRIPMARLASQSKLGYYATPIEVHQHIRQCLNFEPNCRLLDPCCADGEALAAIALGQEVDTYGIELERVRMDKARQVLGHVLWGDALRETQVSSGFDFLFLNPPYDFEEGGKENLRLEYRFLTRYRRALSHRGMIVMIFPVSALRSELLRSEIARLSGLEAFSFSDGEFFDRFNQLLLLGWKKSLTAEQLIQNLALLEDIAGIPPLELPSFLGTTADMAERRYRVAKVHQAKPLEFRSQRLDPERVFEFVSGSTLWRDFFASVEPPSMNDIIPLAPMRQGHLAMLVAAGFCNGAEVFDPEDEKRKILIKGAVKRSSEVASTEATDTHEVTKIIHTHKIRVRMLCVNEARIEEIE
jgi:hypothetical protein